MAATSWTAIRGDLRARIERREWAPGERIPNEYALAARYGCARATVNRALRSLAEEGIVERKRRSGTRVAAPAVRHARLRIPIVRQMVEERGAAYAWRLTGRSVEAPPPDLREAVGPMPAALVHLVGHHLADARTFVFEDRWINPLAVPDAQTVDFSAESPNEWLVLRVPVSDGEMAFQAAPACAREADAFAVPPGTALLRLDRLTRTNGRVVTSVRQTFAPGFAMASEL